MHTLDELIGRIEGYVENAYLSDPKSCTQNIDKEEVEEWLKLVKSGESELKYEKALAIAHSDRITVLKRAINIMLPLTPFADIEDALLTRKKEN